MQGRALLGVVLATAVFSTSQPVQAQDTQTLADIRQQLTVLFVEVQKLKRELSTTGASSNAALSGSVLERASAMESELQRLTAKTERLENRINTVVADGPNRIGDLQFRLCDLEPDCDIATQGTIENLGGGTTAPATAVAEPAPSTDTGELAVGEAAEALASGDFRTAADLFASFNQTYPGGPLAAEAELRRGEALAGLGDVREAARAYLASFTTAPTGPMAPAALTALGQALGALGQTQEACVTLAEVAVRFPDSGSVAQAQSHRSSLACS